MEQKDSLGEPQDSADAKRNDQSGSERTEPQDHAGPSAAAEQASEETGPTSGAGTDEQRQFEKEWSPESESEPTTFDAIKAWAGDLFGEASDVVARPGEFFAGLPEQGGTARATVFALVMGAIAGLLGFILRIFPPLSAIFTTPLAAFAYTVVGTFLIHVLAMLAGGKGTLEGSYRLAAYMMVFLPPIVVAGLLPYLNICIGGYAVYALVMGVVPVHGLEERRAWSVFGAAGALGLLVVLLGTAAEGSSPIRDKLDRLQAQQRRVVEHLEQQMEQLRQRQPR